MRDAVYGCLFHSAVVDSGQITAPCTAMSRNLSLINFNLWLRGVGTGDPGESSNLVDSASSHTLVSKTKPCMSKYKSFTLKLRMAHYISYSLFDSPLLLG